MEDSFPALRTERFMLRRIGPADKPRVFEGLSHPEVIRYYGVSYQTLEETQEQMNWYECLLESRTGRWWAICYPHDPDRLIGACGFNEWHPVHNRTEIGYWLLPAYWGQGIMAECLPVILHHAFTAMHLHRVVAVIEPANHASSRLLQKLGFRYEGTLRQCERKNGVYIDHAYYALLKEEFGNEGVREVGSQSV